MPKCVICGNIMAKAVEPTPKLMELILNSVKEDVLDKSKQDPCDWECCELCWYGVIHSGWDYVWNGVDLMVYDEKEGEWFEFSGTVYKPARTGAIQFEYSKASQTWMAMPRGRGT